MADISRVLKRGLEKFLRMKFPQRGRARRRAALSKLKSL
jgi:hypothetical protein